ncbi:hypothetical protein MMC18_002070 [Xylographa bjoerkii]|nr:hypothetical protein [Xylographa bjoerkii]
MLSVIDDLGPPPAYSPHDPQTPSSDASQQPDTPVSPVRPSIRGGYLSIIDDPQETPFSSAAAYFEGRPFQSNLPLATILIEHTITPHTTRDDLPLQNLLPRQSYGMEARDVHPQDWATFVNYVITELHGSTSIRDQNSEKSVSREDFQERQQRIEAVVAEWNEGFFGPRRIRFVPEFSYSIPDRPSSPTPSYRTSPTAQGPQVDTSFGPALPHQAFRNSPMTSPPHFLHNTQPQVLHPLFTTQPRGAPGKYPNPMDQFATAGGRGWHWRGRGNWGEGRGRHRRGTDDGDSHHGHHRRGKGHRGRSSSTSSSSSDDHRRRGKGRHHRSSSTSSSSSSSSSSSNDSGTSISSNELRGVEVTDIRQAIANFRLDPTRKQHVKQAVRQLRSELRSHRKSVSRGGLEQSKALKAETRTQKRLIKSEVKSLWKEAKQYKKGLKQQRRAEKRMIKAEKRARRRGRGLNDASHEPYPMLSPGPVPGQVSGRCDVEAGPSLNFDPKAGEFKGGLRTGPRMFNGSSKTTAHPFGPNSKYGNESKWSTGMQDMATGESPHEVDDRQRLGVVVEAQTGTTADLWGVGVDPEEMRRRAVVNGHQYQMATERREAHEGEQEKEAEHRQRDSERSTRQREKDAQRREKEIELRVQETDKAAAQRRKEQESAVAEREKDAARRRRGLERDAAQRKRDQERAAAERERDASRRQRDLDRAAEIPGQWPNSQTARQGVLIDIAASADASRGLDRRPSATAPPVTPRSPGSGGYWDHFGASIGQWGTRFGRDAGEWGERLGKDMEAKFS